MLINRAALTEPLLTAAEERDLGLQMEAGLLAREARTSSRQVSDATDTELLLLEERGERARQRYIAANLRLVAKIAGDAAARSRLPEGDLFQEGCLGLIAAVERFDCRRGYKFSTYASFWVRAYVGAATVSQCGALNLSVGRASQLRSLRKTEVELAQSYGRTVSTAELAAAVGRSESWTAELMAHRAPQPMDFLAVDVTAVEIAIAGARSGSWSATAEPGIDEAELEGLSQELLWRLEPLERDVVALRYGFADGTAHPYPEIGRRLQITVSRARRLERRALESLRALCPSSAAVFG